MTNERRPDAHRDLVEQQGVNAAPPAGEETGGRTTAAGGAGTARGGGGEAHAPDDLDLLAAAPDELVGLPEQRPGYPGQQRSVDTS